MRRTTAVRLADLLHEPGVRERINGIVSARKAMFMALYGTDGGLDGGKIDTQAQMAAELLGNLAADTSMRLEEAAESGRRILFEAANGVLLDVDHGTYPFVTSSSTGPNGIAAGAGVPGSLPSCLIGVAKSYSTRVGAGPFVTELKDAFGDRIREQGKEFGTTTGRPRRCGWFDAVACRYAARLNGMTELALLHLDTLSGMDQLGICVAYRLDGEDTDTFPASATQLDRAEPVLEYLPGWSEDLRRVRDYAELPLNARRFVERLEELLGVQASVIGVGPQRSQSIVRGRIRELLEGRRSSEAMRVSS